MAARQTQVFSEPARLVKTLAVVMVAALALGGCSRFSDSLGMSKRSPDEFAVVSKAPLVVPPEFNLRPPDPTKHYAADVDSEAVAFKALFPEGSTLPKPSQGERALIALTGAGSVDPDVRHSLNQNSNPAVRKGAFTREILYGEAKGGNDAPSIERRQPTAVDE
ncbi:MAG: DUF3035 domain-containing protein [Sphingomonadales bacterium]